MSVAGCNKKGYITTRGKKNTHRLWESKDLYFQASKSSISSLEKRSSFSCPCSIVQPQQMGNSVSFFPPSPQTYLNNTHILSTLFGISDWLSALQFARASIHLVGKLGDMEVPLLFTGDENTTSLFSCFIYAKKHFSGLVNSEKQKEKHGRKEILVRGNPLCAQTKKGALGFHSWRMLNLSNGHREWQLLGAWFPPVEGKQNMHVHQS